MRKAHCKELQETPRFDAGILAFAGVGSFVALSGGTGE